MNILFIANKHNNYCGGEVCTQRNISILKELCQDGNFTEIRIERDKALKKHNHIFWQIQGFLNDIRFCSISGIDSKQLQHIHRTIKEKNIHTVFIDKSTLGMLAKEIRTHYPYIKIITFFHNIEYSYYKRELELNGKWMLRYRLSILRKNEKAACIYSHTNITLNNRDEQQLKLLYGRTADYTLPITLKDCYTPHTRLLAPTIPSSNPHILFVGSYFSMNIEGILHFVQHILPHTQAHLTIVGTGMNQLATKLKNNKLVEIMDFTPNLTALYEKASFVVIPIYSGSGMKVKTAEALMYGKYIIGTPEAFTGYDISPEIGIQCSNDAQFIQAINECRHQGYNPASRELFLSKYSNNQAIDILRKIIFTPSSTSELVADDND